MPEELILAQAPLDLRQYGAEQTKPNIPANLPPLPGTLSWQFPKERGDKKSGITHTHQWQTRQKEQMVLVHRLKQAKVVIWTVEIPNSLNSCSAHMKYRYQ